MPNPRLADDIVMGVFYFFPNNRRQFRDDRQKRHEFFYEQKQKYPDLMRCIGFRNREHFPESEALDQAYSNLYGNLLHSWGYDFNPHEVDPALKSAFERQKMSLFSPEDLKKLAKISREFQRRFSLEETVTSK